MNGAALVRSGLVVAVVMLLGRVSGLARELVLAHTMGVGAQADVAVLLLSLPDGLTQALGAGAVVTVLVPVFQSANPAGPASAAIFRRCTKWALGAGMLLGAFAWAGTSVMVMVLAPGFSLWQQREASHGLALVAWTLPLSVTVLVSAAWLHAQASIAVVIAGTILFNAAIIASLLSAPGSLQALAFGVFAAAAIRWASQLLVLGRVAWRSGTTDPPAMPQGLARQFAEAAGTAAVLLSMPLVIRAIGSLSVDGTVAMLNYATRILEVPMGLAIGVAPVVLFPHLSAAATDRDDHRFQSLLSLGWVAVLMLSVPIAGTLSVFGDVAARVVFGLTQLDEAALVVIGRLIGCGALGLPALGLALLYQSALNAMRDTRGPLVAGAIGLGLLVVTGPTAVGAAGGVGLTLTVSVCQWLLAGLLWWRLRRRHGVTGLGPGVRTAVVWTCVVTATFVLGADWATRNGGMVWRIVAAVAAGSLSLGMAVVAQRRLGLALPQPETPGGP
jgi:putative peptidoglycan lipid II flippase